MPVDLDAKVKVDLVVVGSVAVSEKGLLVPEIYQLDSIYFLVNNSNYSLNKFDFGTNVSMKTLNVFIESQPYVQ